MTGRPSGGTTGGMAVALRSHVRLRKAPALLGAAACLVLLPACTSSGPDQPEPVVTPDPLPLPSYADIAAAHNARVAMLDRLWAATTAIVTYEDQDGRVRTEQAEGHLQIIQPASVALSLGKQITSEVYFYLGSNAERYWWLDRVDPERKVAYVGTHAMATPARAAQFGAPVHPLDLLDLLGITPLPEAATDAEQPAERDGPPGEPPGEPAGAPTPDGVRVSWSPDGNHIVVEVPGRFGARRVWFDPDRMLPRRVEILNSRGRVAVHSTLDQDVIAEVSEDSRQRPLMSSQVEMEVPGTAMSVRLRMTRIENRGSGQRAAPFNYDGVLRAYAVDRVEDLDLLEVEEEAETGGVRVPDRRLRTGDGR